MQSKELKMTIGFILPNTSNYFCHTLIDQFEQTFSQKGYRMITAITNHDIAKECEYIKYMSKHTDGILIISDAGSYDEIKDAVNDRVPIIFLNRQPENCPHTSVVENDYTAVFQTIVSLTNDISSKIACICSKPELSTTAEITHAYEAAMKLSPEGFHKDWIYYQTDASANISEIVELMTEKGCNVFFTCTQSLTEQFMDYIFLHNSMHTDPLVLAGFSNNTNETSLQKSIDMVTQPIDQLVDLSSQLLIYQIAHPDTPPKKYLIKGTMRKRTLDRFRISFKEN